MWLYTYAQNVQYKLLLMLENGQSPEDQCQCTINNISNYTHTHKKRNYFTRHFFTVQFFKVIQYVHYSHFLTRYKHLSTKLSTGSRSQRNKSRYRDWAWDCIYRCASVYVCNDCNADVNIACSGEILNVVLESVLWNIMKFSAKE